MVTIKHILCPIDFSDFSCRALMRAAAIAKPQGAMITALHVVPLVPLAAPLYSPNDVAMPLAIDIGAGERDSLLAKLRGFVRAATPDGVVETDVVTSPTVYEEILAQASERNADLIVMGTHGRTGLHRLVLGSVTERVLRTAHQPVLTVGLSATSSAQHVSCVPADCVRRRFLGLLGGRVALCPLSRAGCRGARHCRQRARMATGRIRPASRSCGPRCLSEGSRAHGAGTSTRRRRRLRGFRAERSSN